MLMERRGTRGQYLGHLSSPTARGGETKSPSRPPIDNKWHRYALLAQKKSAVFTTPFNLIDRETLMEGYHALSGKKAVGIDGVSKLNFGEDLENNIDKLHEELHKGTYRPSPKKEVLIPKANGKKRPIAISTFRDKIVEHALGRIFTVMYEPVFIRNSFGFRPNKSAHGAIEASYMILKDAKRPWVVEIDFANFFNTVPHRELMKIISERMKDKRLSGLVGRFLKAEIISLEKRYFSKVGTPQGSVMSPILANIYLNHVVDKWFAENYANMETQMIRYADDAIFMFATKEKAESFLKDFTLRVESFKLKLNEEKTKIIDFREDSGNVFNFLGFTFYWGRKYRKMTSSLRVTTQKDKLFKKVDEYKDWIKKARSQMSGGKIAKMTALKLRGHYNYYGYQCNRANLVHFRYQVTEVAFKWLNRRSQKKSYSRKSFMDLIEKVLPHPPAFELLKPLGVRYAR
jgi:RNA-directed DNA polymerase